MYRSTPDKERAFDSYVRFQSNPNISLVVRANGGFHYSENKKSPQTPDINILNNLMKQFWALSQQQSSRIFNYSGTDVYKTTNGDLSSRSYFQLKGTSPLISLVVDNRTGQCHLSQNNRPYNGKDYLTLLKKYGDQYIEWKKFINQSHQYNQQSQQRNQQNNMQQQPQQNHQSSLQNQQRPPQNSRGSLLLSRTKDEMENNQPYSCFTSDIYPCDIRVNQVTNEIFIRELTGNRVWQPIYDFSNKKLAIQFINDLKTVGAFNSQPQQFNNPPQKSQQWTRNHQIPQQNQQPQQGSLPNSLQRQTQPLSQMPTLQQAQGFNQQGNNPPPYSPEYDGPENVSINPETVTSIDGIYHQIPQQNQQPQQGSLPNSLQRQTQPLSQMPTLQQAQGFNQQGNNPPPYSPEYDGPENVSINPETVTSIDGIYHQIPQQNQQPQQGSLPNSLQRQTQPLSQMPTLQQLQGFNQQGNNPPPYSPEYDGPENVSINPETVTSIDGIYHQIPQQNQQPQQGSLPNSLQRQTQPLSQMPTLQQLQGFNQQGNNPPPYNPEHEVLGNVSINLDSPDKATSDFLLNLQEQAKSNLDLENSLKSKRELVKNKKEALLGTIENNIDKIETIKGLYYLFNSLVSLNFDVLREETGLHSLFKSHGNTGTMNKVNYCIQKQLLTVLAKETKITEEEFRKCQSIFQKQTSRFGSPAQAKEFYNLSCIKEIQSEIRKNQTDIENKGFCRNL